MLGVVADVVGIHYLWYLVSHALLMNGVNQMPRGLVVSFLLIVNMTLCICQHK
jgi:hypothetical protein